MYINDPHQGGFVLPGRKRRQHEEGYVSRLPLLDRLPKAVQGHFVAMSGEFVGTFLFLFFAYSGTQVANTQTQSGDSTTISQAANPAQLLYISLCFGFSLAVNAWVFFRISGGLFNPAVTLGMCLIGALPYVRGGLLFIAQMLACMCSAAVVSCLFPGPLNVKTSLGAGTSIAQGLFIEMFLTTELVFTIFMLAAEKHKATFIAPVGIGLALFVAELTGVFYTGGSLNPARSFGPAVVLRAFEGDHWIYWVGPLLGALLASGFYKFIKMLEYETANPGQDFDEKEDAAADPDKDVREVQRPSPMAAPAPNTGGGGHSRDHSGDHTHRQSRGQSGDYSRGQSRGQSGEYSRGHTGGGGQRYSQGPNAEAGKAGHQRGAGRDLRDRR